MGWSSEKVEEIFEKYHNDYEKFNLLKSNYQDVSKEIENQRGSLKTVKSERLELEYKLKELNETEIPSYEEEVEKIRNKAEEELVSAKKQLEEDEIKIANEKDKAIQANDQKLSDKLKAMLGENADSVLNISDSEKAAMEFEKRRVGLTSDKDNEIMALENQIGDHQLASKKDIKVLNDKRNAVKVKYEPGIKKYQEIVDKIKKKYEPDIAAASDSYDDARWKRELETEELENERRGCIATCDKQIEIAKKNYEKNYKDLQRQIAVAVSQKKSTTRLENSQQSLYNKAEKEIAKANNTCEIQLTKIDAKIEKCVEKWGKIIAKADEKYAAILGKQNKELEEPTEKLKDIENERDCQFEEIDRAIETRKRQGNDTIAQINNQIQECKRIYNDNIDALNSEMQAYAMAGNTCFDKKLEEAYQPFRNLDNKVPIWQNLLYELSKTEEDADKLIESEKSALCTLDYDGLITAVNSSGSVAEKLNIMLERQKQVFIGAGILDCVTIGLLISLAKMNPLMAILIPTVVLGGLCAYLVMWSSKMKKVYARALALAKGYEDFTAIKQHSRLMTQQEEFNQLCETGRRLFEKFLGPEEAKKQHTVAEQDIKGDYERKLQLTRAIAEEKTDSITRHREEECFGLRQKLYDLESTHEESLRKYNNELKNISSRIDELEGLITRLDEEKSEMEEFFKNFEANYKDLEKDLMSLEAKMEETHGRLNNKLYVIPDADSSADQYGHKPIYCIEHGKKPLIITYDTYMLENAEDYNKELSNLVNRCLVDFMLGIKRINSRDTYEQYIVDQISGGTLFQRAEIKNDLSIIKSCGSIDEIKDRLVKFLQIRNRMAEHGDTIDALNEKCYEKQAKPETYKILYMVFKADMSSGRMNEEIFKLLPECNRYGFLPVFICSSEVWKQGITQDNSIYKEIQKSTNNAAIEYDGSQYIISA